MASSLRMSRHGKLTSVLHVLCKGCRNLCGQGACCRVAPRVLLLGLRSLALRCSLSVISVNAERKMNVSGMVQCIVKHVEVLLGVRVHSRCYGMPPLCQLLRL
jgi:hypothetical protein